jgi:hypothetical protein
MWAGVAQKKLVSSVLFSPYVNDIPTTSCHIKSAQYADDTALIAMSHSPLLLVSYVQTYLGRLRLWQWDWRIAINVLNSTTVLSAKAMKCNQKPRQLQFLGQPIQWVETAHYLGATLDTQGEKEGS